MAFLDYPGLQRFTSRLKSWINGIVGDSDMGTTADTITGAIAEHSGQIADLEAVKPVKAVNHLEPDDNGNVNISTVDYAYNIATDSSQASEGEFTERTTGGDASLADGPAWLATLRGVSRHDNFVPEVLDKTIYAPRTAPPEITAQLNEQTFEAYVGVAGTYVLTYTTSWSSNPALYGVTVTNAPMNGDSIQIYWDGDTAPEMTVINTPRVRPDSITATIDHDTYVEAVGGSGTTVFSYDGSAWNYNLAAYGITVSGTPLNGDTITVVYTAESRGTIYVSTPSSFVSTGWNLFSYATGYARVLKYRDNATFRIEGAYTAVQFSETISGAKTTVSVVNNGFTINSDGYIWVTGGDNTSTCVYMTWSDWGEGYDGDWKEYTESVVDQSNVIVAGKFFPNGMFQVGAVSDVIDFDLGVAYSYIERMAYSAANLAIAQASGRNYEYDENYIYLVRATPVSTDIDVNKEYAACDHGIEYFANTDTDCYVSMLYGQNLVEYLEHDVPNHFNNLNDIKADTLVFESDDPADIKTKLFSLPLNKGATAYFADAAMSVMSGGKRPNVVRGLIIRTATNDFQMLGRLASDKTVISLQIAGVSAILTDSDFGTYVESLSSKLIRLDSNDTTWENVYAKLSTIASLESATIVAASQACSAMTNGVRSSRIYGFISRRSGSEFHLIFTLDTNSLIAGSITGCSSSSAGTYTESEALYKNQVKNNHSTTDEGYVLDARQGKSLYDTITERVVGKRQTKSITGSSSAQSIRIDLANGGFLIILSITGLSKIWFGLVYCGSDGSTSVQQMNTSTGITVTTGSSSIYANFTHTSDSTMNMVAIPLRSNTAPTFH